MATNKPYVSSVLRITVSRQSQARDLKTQLARHHRFKSRCAICHAKRSRSGFTFHHLYYNPDEKTYKDFSDALAYYEYLAPIIRQTPHQFVYLCSAHHQALERICRYGEKNWKRLSRLRGITLASRAQNAKERCTTIALRTT